MVEPFHRNVPTRTVMQIINILPLNLYLYQQFNIEKKLRINIEKF